ncbi:MAG: asparaginase [bacterium]
MIINLATVYRNKQIESIHYGVAVLVKGDKIIKSWGNADFKCFTRSIIKPIQAKVSLSFISKNIPDKYIAIACASHNNTPEQLKTLLDLSQEYEIEEDSLKLGLLKGSNLSSGYLKSKFAHNCAGKHTLMRISENSLMKEINPSEPFQNRSETISQANNYINESHPLQQSILSEIKRLGDIKNNQEIITGIDGCGLPTFHLSLQEMAKIFSKTAEEKEYQKIYKAMNEHPLLIGGPNQIDSLIMQARPNNFMAKGGAEGLMLVLNLINQECLIIKIIDGSSRAKNIITKGFLEHLGWLNPGEILLDENILNSQELVVGNISFNVR